MAPVYNPQNAPVFFIGVKGDVIIKDQSGNDIKLKKGDKIPSDARIIVGDGGKIVFKQANKTLKYDSQGEASLSTALTESSDATQDPGIKNLVKAAEQITTTPERPSEATPIQQPLAKPVARPDTSTPSPTPAKQGISEPPEIVNADRGEAPQADATEIVTKMAEQVASRSDAIKASTTEAEAPSSAAGETVTVERNHKSVAPDETPLPPAAPDITSFAPNTGSGDDNITSEKELTISGTAPAGTHLEFDNPASDDNYNFVTYNKAAVITGTATPGLTFILTQGNNRWDITADDKGTWSQAVTNLNDGLAEFTASSVSVAGVEVHKTAKLLVQSTPYDFQIQPDTGISDTDAITNSEDLLLTVKSQPDATVVLTILGKDLESTVNKDGLAEFPVTLAGDSVYNCQLKTIYTNNEGESDTVEETITLDTTPAIINLDQLQSIYKDSDVSFTGQCDENGSTVSIKLVNVFKPGVSVSTAATVENGVFKATATVPEQGEYRAEVSVVDVAGNASNPQDYTFEYQPPKPELVILTRPDDSSANANPEWTGTFPHEGKLQISFAGKTDTITVQADNTWSYQFSEAFDFERHTVTFTGTQAGLPGSAIEQDSFTVVMPEMQLTIDDAPAERTNLLLTEWKGSGAAPDAKVTLTLTPVKGDVVEQTVDADDQGFFTIALKLNEGNYSTALNATASGYQDASLTGSNVTVDRTGPVLQVDPGFKPTAGTCTLTGKALDQDGQPESQGTVTIEIPSIQKSFTGTINNGDFSVQINGLKPEQTYQLHLYATDELQNTGSLLDTSYTTPALPVTDLQLAKAPDSHTSDNLLQWEGTATPGATVTLTTASGQPVSKEVTADAKGFFVVSETVAEGQYTASLSATAAGLQPAALPGKTITVDQTGPVLTIDPNFQLTAGSCTLTGKALDQDGQPESQGTVTVGIPSIQKSFTGIINNGDFSVQINGLKPEQTYQLHLSATDELQNTGSLLDTSYTTPALPVTDLQLAKAPDSHTSDNLLQWEGTATPGATVTLTLTTASGQPVSKEVTADAKGFFVVSETVAEGQYTASLSATATGLQPFALADKTITVDQTGPVLTIDPNFQLTAGSCTLTGKSLDQGGQPESQGTVMVGIPSIQKSFTGIISNGDFSVQIDGLKPEQTYQLHLSATDELQNTGSLLDTSYTTPALPVTDLQLAKAPDSHTGDNLLQWEGTATPGATVTLTLTTASGQPVSKEVTADAKGFFVVSETVAEGQYTASLSATATGLQPAALPGKTITVDQTGPVLTIDPNFQLTAGSCTLTGKALDQGGQPESQGTVTVGIPSIQKSFTGIISNGDFSVQIDGLKPEQTYQLHLSATDELQNTGSLLDTSYKTPALPVTDLQLAKAPDSHTSDNLLQWEGTATSGATVTLNLTTASGQPVSKEVTADAKGFFVVSETVAEGQYTASLSATATGLQPAALTDKTITVDQTGPVLTIDPNFQLTAGSCTLTGKALDQDGQPESQSTVTVGIPSIQKSFTGIINNGDFSVQINGLKPEQTYQLHLSATDELQNTGSLLDTSYTTPALPVTDLQLAKAPDSHTSDNLLQWEGTATSGATVTLTLTTASGQPVRKEVTADAKGFFVVSETVAEGQYTASLSATATGLQPAALTDKTITVDQTGPVLTIDPNFQLTAGSCTLTGKALDQGGQPESQGTVTVGIPSIQKSFTGIINNGDFSVQINGLKPEQTYQLHLSATDELQNTGSLLDTSYTTPALPKPVAYDFAVTSDLKTDAQSIVLKGTHPLPRGRVQLKLTGDNVNTINKNSGIITGRAKNHEWSIELNNLLLKQKAQLSLHAMDDAAEAKNAKFLPNVPELQETLVVDGDARDSSIGNLKALSGAGVYGHHIVMYAAKCSGKCNNKDGLEPWKVELTSPVQPGAKVLVTLDTDTVTVKGKPQKIQDRPYIKPTKLDDSGKAILEQPLDYTKKGNLKIDLSKEHLKPATIRFKAEGLEHSEEVFVGVETPSLHYTFDNIQPGQDILVSQSYPAYAMVLGSVNQVQGSVGSGLQLGKGSLQIQDFKDLFNDSYTICFDIKTSAKALTSNQLYPALAGYYDQTSNTGAKTHLFGAFNEKGQIGIADHNSGYFAEPVVADGQWHSVCISRNLLAKQDMSTYRMLIDGKQAEISKDGSSVKGKEALMVHGTILNSPVSEYPIELLGGVTKSDSPDEFEYLDAVLDNFTAYPINMEIPNESSAYAHVHWHCPDGDICFYESEFPAGLMINEIMGSKLTPDSSLYLQLQPDVSNKSLGTSFTVKYKGTSLDPQDVSPSGDNVYKLDGVSAENLATLTVQPADPKAAHKFELHFDRTESDLIRGADKDVSMPDGIIKFDSSASPLGSGISFGVGKEQSYSPSEGDPNCILEDRHLVTEPGTIINSYDIDYSTIIDLNGLKALKILTQESDMNAKLHQLMSEGSAQQGTEHQVQLQDPCILKDPSCTNDPLVTINTVDNNPAIALSLDGQITYYQHT
ncbi:hypothetical protein NX722_10750 [Endozoicomonas gorgoniicola]|uniref:Uncharacterized protein n=1 Tax=Endozoicomonas gorgoniicola TaxID=1234144 RepID=A0ABT3MUP6_9GAMM|nr:hypothetical protein [Endozoicomonas gorgoniicola]MCW7553104.1 hypothetical protein [Endozoicomonas gorgoniicola]